MSVGNLVHTALVDCNYIKQDSVFYEVCCTQVVEREVAPSAKSVEVGIPSSGAI
jgi:hypothetical protein